MKNRVLSIVLQTFFLVVFNAMYFLLVADHTTTRWICYAAVHIAYLLMLAGVNSIPAERVGAVHGYPKVAAAMACFIVTLLAGVAFIALDFNEPIAPTIVFTLLIGGFTVYYGVLMYSEEHSINSEKGDARALFFVRNSTSRLRGILGSVPDAGIRKEVERIHDAVAGAQGMSVPEAARYESRVGEQLDELERMLADKAGAEAVRALAQSVIATVRQRDETIKLARIS